MRNSYHTKNFLERTFQKVQTGKDKEIIKEILQKEPGLSKRQLGKRLSKKIDRSLPVSFKHIDQVEEKCSDLFVIQVGVQKKEYFWSDYQSIIKLLNKKSERMFNLMFRSVGLLSSFKKYSKQLKKLTLETVPKKDKFTPEDLQKLDKQVMFNLRKVFFRELLKILPKKFVKQELRRQGFR